MNQIHVLTNHELETMPEGAVVWMESRHYQENPLMPDSARLQPLVMYNGVYGNYFSYLVPNEFGEEDRKEVRFWNYRPTIETMEKEEWE